MLMGIFVCPSVLCTALLPWTDVSLPVPFRPYLCLLQAEDSSSLLKFPLKNEHQHAAVFLVLLELLDAKLFSSAKFKYLLVLVDVVECSSQLLIGWKCFILIMSVIMLVPECSRTVITACPSYLSHYQHLHLHPVMDPCPF